ncbi:MlaD family protein [[Mycobacterium] wendilense]|uniref:MlaD family protein n=1 Tax=[Mycobacterium] wendilense TaxID=3064284 RepID=A0ABM9MEQ0_9MYCO|nr:MlaD family protein [Mycolicibacterium sp. MU0050]CAJ1583463.1 MlaD family protein [Mycolicibacterium sp. MU0050]
MRISRRIWTQLAIVGTVSTLAFASLMLVYIKLPSLLFGIGKYRVTVELAQAAGLYERANVTYRGTAVGEVTSVSLAPGGGVRAELQLDSSTRIPADLDAEVHSQTAVGEQFITLLPRSDGGPQLKDGDVISAERTSVPPDINALLDATNVGLAAVPQDNLKTLVDEAYLAVGGLGPEISRLVKGSAAVAIDAEENLDAWTALLDHAAPVLNTQTETSDAVRSWAANLAGVTEQLRGTDAELQGILHDGGPALGEARQLFDRVQPTLPIVLANLVTVGEVAVTYRDSIEQLLVLLPQGAAAMQAIGVANRNTEQDYAGAFLSFNLNVNLPPPCTTGFLPARQQRVPSLEDYPDRPAGDLYCRTPQDSGFNVRGARNTPCVTRPGKRAPTWQMCESDEEYVPLNDGFNWKGDPNATLSGQDIPQLTPSPAGRAAPAPPVAFAEYDPATGTYVGPDGKTFTQSNLAPAPNGERTWQNMLMP